MIPTLTAVEQSQEVYALNIVSWNTEEPAGSVFERYRRDVDPFEAYVTDKPESTNSPAMFSISDNGGGTTDIRVMLEEADLETFPSDSIAFFVIESADERIVEIYGTNGMLLRTVEVNEGINQITDLEKGVYFLEGQKVVVK